MNPSCARSIGFHLNWSWGMRLPVFSISILFQNKSKLTCHDYTNTMQGQIFSIHSYRICHHRCCRFMKPIFIEMSNVNNCHGKLILTDVLVISEYQPRKTTWYRIYYIYYKNSVMNNECIWGNFSNGVLFSVNNNGLYTAGKDKEYLESTMETLVFDILICWK